MATSENGWTSDILCTKWFKRSFVPQAIARHNEHTPILLIFDGHRSHVTSEMVHLACASNIILYCLPRKTTHKLQPLDMGIFGPLQNTWQKVLEKYLAERGIQLSQSHVIPVYMEARERSFTE